MIRKEDLRSIIREQHQSWIRKSGDISRKAIEKIDVNSNQALVITGVRRCGKSTLLGQVMQQVNGTRVLSFEDIRLIDFDPSDFIKAETVFEEEFGQSDYFFFDEIQNIQGWERYVRQLLDSRKKVVITGSNGRLLSRELGTHLTGRHLDYELFPFSFDEFQSFTGEGRSLDSFSKYLILGGFPEFLVNRKQEYLQNLMTDILIRDIAVRRGIRNVKTLKEIAVFLMSNIAKEFSFHSIRKTFNVGSVSTVIEYISFLEECYLFFTIPRFDFSLKKQAYHPKKIYAVDNALAIANSLSFSSDTGRMLENLVFGMLRRKFRDIFYFRNRRECDFIVREPNGVYHVIQVCAKLDHDNQSREIDGLVEAMTHLDLKTGYLLTMDERDELTQNGCRIMIMPVMDYMSG